MEKTAIVLGAASGHTVCHLDALPETGEALISPKTVRVVLGMSESKLWESVKNDPDFPKPACREKRYTRFRLSEVRAYIADMSCDKPRRSTTLARTTATGTLLTSGAPA